MPAFGLPRRHAKKPDQLGKLFLAVITSYIDSYFLENQNTARLACLLACESPWNIF